MANTDFRLGQWFKQVDAKEQQLREKKKTVVDESVSEPKPIVQDASKNNDNANINSAREVSASLVADIDNTSMTYGESAQNKRTSSVTLVERDNIDEIYEDAEIPDVEDFISFLDNTEQKPAATYIPSVPVIEKSAVFTEGTGEPKPYIEKIAPEVKSVEPIKMQKIADKPAVEEKIAVKKVKQTASAPKVDMSASLQENWDRMPHHLQVLFGTPQDEVAQRSYKTFKQTRDMLIQTLLDPSLSLEETARILNVCPTTVRRYTNRGSLMHYRTAGNQRRFKLSDVLNFMENNLH